jgi:L-fucose isomerase-like protein
MIPTFVCKPGRVTLARLGRLKGESVMQVSSGTAFSPSREQLTKGWENLPHIFINMDSDPEYFIQNTRSNHMHWAYGDFKEELKQVCRILKIKYIGC